MIKTPRELSRLAVPHHVRQLQSPPALDGFAQLVAQLNAPGTPFTPRCFFCNKESCSLLTCEAAIKAKANPFAQCRLGKFFNVRTLDAELPPKPTTCLQLMILQSTFLHLALLIFYLRIFARLVNCSSFER